MTGWSLSATHRSIAVAAVFILLIPYAGPLWAQDAQANQDAPQEHEVDAAETPTAPPVIDDPAAVISEAEQSILEGKYDEAIALLQNVIASQPADPEVLQLAYLQLIKAHVSSANRYQGQPQGHQTARLYMDEASDLTVQCLNIFALRHTIPDPPEQYPPQMTTLFDDVRSEIMGGFRIVSLNPGDSEVRLDGRKLLADSLTGQWEETDLLVGDYTVLIRHDGYKDFTQEISVSANSIREESYDLDKKKGFLWYAGGAVLAVGVGAGIYALANQDDGGGGDTQTQPTALPGAPPPPPAP